MADDEQARCVVELMVLAAWADGHVEGAEAIAIQKLVHGLPELAHVGRIADIASAARAKLQAKGMDACVQEAAAGLTDKTMRELAFQCCARVTGSDSVFASEEEEFLRKLQVRLGLSVDDMRRLLVLAAPGTHGGPPVR